METSLLVSAAHVAAGSVAFTPERQQSHLTLCQSGTPERTPLALRRSGTTDMFNAALVNFSAVPATSKAAGIAVGALVGPLVAPPAVAVGADEGTEVELSVAHSMTEMNFSVASTSVA